MSYAAYHPGARITAKGVLFSLALPREPIEAHRYIVAGLSPAIVSKLAMLLGSDTKTVCQVAGIDRTTFTRKAKAGALLSQDQSARVYWLAQVLDAAVSLHEGDWAKVMRWLNKPAWGLGGQRPVVFLTTAVGAQAVIDLIGQIEHGVAV